MSLVVLAASGALVGMLGFRRRPASEPEPGPEADAGIGGAEVEQVLSALPEASIVVDPNGTPIRVSSHALAMTLIRDGRIVVPEITAMIADVRRDGIIREHETTVRRPPMGKGLVTLRLRVAPLGADRVLVLYQGRVVREVAGAELNEDTIVRAALGASEAADREKERVA